MNYARVAVVSYEDPEFQNTVGNFLADQFSINPEYLDVLTRSNITTSNLEIFLVNSDGLHSNRDFVQSFRTATGRNVPRADKSIFMLTRNLKAMEFLRNQELKASDTIDIGQGMGGLKVALAGLLLERQLSLFKQVLRA